MSRVEAGGGSWSDSRWKDVGFLLILNLSHNTPYTMYSCTKHHTLPHMKGFMKPAPAVATLHSSIQRAYESGLPPQHHALREI